MELLKFYTDKEYKRLEKLNNIYLSTYMPSVFEGLDQVDFKTQQPILSNPNSPVSVPDVAESLIPAIEFYGYKFFGRIISRIQTKRNKRKEKKEEKKISKRKEICDEWNKINSNACQRYFDETGHEISTALEYPNLLDNNGDYINFRDLHEMPERLERLHSFINNHRLANDDQIVNLFYGYKNMYLNSRYEITQLGDTYVVKISLKELKKEEILYFFSKTPFQYNILMEPIKAPSLSSQSNKSIPSPVRNNNADNIEIII